jgi:hypothetical protein
MSDEDIYAAQVRHLERELAAARETLRDRFAMAALTGYLASWAPHEEPCEFSSSIAEDCYRLADAMMEARKS